MPDDVNHTSNYFYGPVNAVGSVFGSGKINNISRPADAGADDDPVDGLPMYSGRTKREVCGRLDRDWEDLADELSIPIPHQRRFAAGREAADIWDWLEQRRRLGSLRDALRGIDRQDLVNVLDEDAVT
ncbi:death domain-containing protein [Dactylosporangium sp. NPDC051484]|uniref:death domain-containing protein n=1 Tax=Dactylosporangium sp. NPDC051484 TaxID=3154942 RepID=UPI00344FD158